MFVVLRPSNLIQESSGLVRLANKTVDVARTRDPLPGLREVAAGLRTRDPLPGLREVVAGLRTRDPLPGLREVVAGLSNDQAHAHFRRTRPVVYNLRDTTINLNTELRALVRLSDALQKTLAKDLPSLGCSDVDLKGSPCHQGSLRTN